MKKGPSTEKTSLHAANRNRKPYDLQKLKNDFPEIKNFIAVNAHGNESIDFANPKAVKVLNQALLKSYYGIDYWDFPDTNLCPPIPGRADYIHYIHDLIQPKNGQQIVGLDIGTGASCIYPILGVAIYDWEFVAADIDARSIRSAINIVNKNEVLKEMIDCRVQAKASRFFRGIIDEGEKFAFTMCNPPFHATAQDAFEQTNRKAQNLAHAKFMKPKVTVPGLSNELVCEGGEFVFISNMIEESKLFAKQVKWFTSLVSKGEHVKPLIKRLETVGCKEHRVIEMATGNKQSRILAWRF